MIRRSSDEQKLIEDVAKNRKTGKVSVATLRTDDRVLARITDGIYRQPSSALRELISNAYDADATDVVIHTDAPRFKQITIRDNGNGMDIAALARLINHIGGSTKRRADGADLGVTRKDDPSLSPRGRRLIGKIGIGLFSVAQLTRHFQIVTKVKGENYRLVAEVVLQTFNEDEIAKRAAKKGRTSIVETGTVRIVSVQAEDTAAQGTEIILMDLRPQARELLQSKETWAALAAGELDPQDILPQVREPSFHVGQIDNETSRITRAAKLPWNKEDAPAERFRKLYQAVIDEVGNVESNPRLETTLDTYLKLLWTLSLASPVDYIEKHPFDLRDSGELTFYQLTPSRAGPASPLALGAHESVRKKLALCAPERGPSNLPFRVFIDDVELLRPIRFHNLPKGKQKISKPMLFVGSAAPDLSKISVQERGGDLAFEVYFLWAPKIVPKENTGLLIRIGDASGTLFDETFAKYQVSENTRLKQITAEVFVLRGLDAALNIDRESFNYAHPHYQYIMRWVHRALRQVVNTLKYLAADVRSSTLKKEQRRTTRTLEGIVGAEVVRASGDKDAEPADVDLTGSSQSKLERERKKGRLALDADKVFEPLKQLKPGGKKDKRAHELLQRQVKAVAQVLDAYGLLDGLTYARQEELLRAIVMIFSVDKGK